MYELQEEDDPEESGYLVAEHKDLGAVEQTISFKEPDGEITVKEQGEPDEPVIESKPASTPGIVKTGDENSLMLLVILLIISCVVMFTCVRIARKD